ncbi:MAG TPA: hypothetical protein VL625_01160 [Patescibacteria group bacterium]|nr:hypothetical protein [Patescibacteria group bacterium]
MFGRKNDTGPVPDPACIDAPIIVTAADRPAFEAFMKGLDVDNRPVARLESARLAPYWMTLSNYMADALVNRREAASAEKPSKGPTLDDLIQPQNLAALFNGVADYNRNTVLSQIAIVPDSFLRDEKLKKEIFDGKALYGGNTLHHGRNFNFGFVQVYARNEKMRRASSISFPLLSLDTPMLELVAPHQPKALLSGLQTVMNSGNHDMLHHMTNEIVNSTISASFRREPWREFFGVRKTNRPLWDWDRKYFSTGGGDSHPLSYESWLIMTQQQVRGRAEIQPGPQQGQVKAAADSCCQELKRISAELQEAGPTPAEGIRNAHRAVDYFGSMVAYALSRFQPITSPYIDTLLEAMEEADPLGSASEKECLLGLVWARAHEKEFDRQAAAYGDLEKLAGMSGDTASITALLKENLYGARASSESLRDTFVACAVAGQPLEPEEGKPSYTQLKRIGVATISPWIARVCTAPDSEAVAKPIARAPGAALDMVEALAKMLKFKPSPAIA